MSPAPPTAGAEPAGFDDARRIGALRRGDAEAFEAVYRSRCRLLYGLAYHLTGQPAEAEELVQEVFVRAWQHRADFESPEHFDRWLRRVAVNVWINRQRRQREASLDAPAGDGPAPEPQMRPAPVGTRLDVRRALAALPPALRAVVVLFDVYGLRHEEIAALLEITPGSSKVQLHRARQRLKEWLQ